LNVTQPAVTRAIQNLEEHLGFALFSREGYRPVLTPQGEAFYQRVQPLLKEIENLESFSAQMATGLEPALHLAVDGYYLLPQILAAFHETNREYPCTQLHIHCELLGGSLERLLQKDCDLAIMGWEPRFERRRDLLSLPVACLQVSTMVAANFPLLKQVAPVTETELAPFIQVIERTHSSHGNTAGGFGINPLSQHWYVNDVHTKKQVILSGRSYGMLPHALIEPELKQGLLQPFEQMEGYRVYEGEIRAVCLKDRPMGPVLSKLWQKLHRLPRRREQL